MDLNRVMNDVTDAIIEVDRSGVPFRSFKPGVGPYGEPQLLKLIVGYMNRLPTGDYVTQAIDPKTRRIIWIRREHPEHELIPAALRTAYVAPTKKKESIFISHSSADMKKFVDPAAQRIRRTGMDAFIASRRPKGKSPADKIIDAISSSKALFVIITQNVTTDRETRDWVLFEIGAAKAAGISVYGWKTPEVHVPEPIKQVTDYIEVNDKNVKEVKQMLQTMGSLAKTL